MPYRDDFAPEATPAPATAQQSSFGQKIGIEAQITEARRELRMREKVYPGWVRQGKISEDDALLRMAVMEEIIRTLERVRGPLPQRELAL
jgi:hypothetical protein